jgi:hypothetical protein
MDSPMDSARLAAERPTETDDLYHYTSATVAIDSIVPQMQIRLGLLEATNDPRESRPRYPSLSLAHGVPNEDAQQIWKEADLYLRRSAKVACFTIDYSLPDWSLEAQRLRGYAHPALWAHYGGAHTGVCLGFNRQALSERLSGALSARGTLFEGHVRYSSESWTGRANAEGFDVEQINEFGLDVIVTGFIAKHYKELFFHKHDDWSSEHEYRWVLVEPGLIPVYVGIEGALTGIVLGDAFSADRLGSVHELARRCGGVEVSQVRAQNGGLIRMPVPAPTVLARPHRRSGTVDERVTALIDSETEAAQARALAQAQLRPLIAKVHEVILRVQDAVKPRAGVRAEVLSRAHGVPPADRARKPGVPTYDSHYDAGELLVLTNEMPTIGFIASVAVQSLKTDHVRLHAALSVRDLGSSDPETELWRTRRQVDGDRCDAEASIGEIGDLMLEKLPEALDAFDSLRAES